MKRSYQLLSSARKRGIALAALAATIGIGLAPSGVSAQDFSADKTQRITTPRVAGVSGASLGASVSTDGRFLVFETDSKNLTGATTTNVRHIVLLDRQVNAYELISVATDGSVADGDSRNAQISKTGRYVVFESDATNLDEDGAGTNAVSQIYVRDRFIARTYLISRASGLSGTVGNGASTNPSINGTGQFVAYESDATNLLPGGVPQAPCTDDLNGVQDIYTRNGGTTLSTSRASVAPGFHGSGDLEFDMPSFNPFITDDGSKIAFSTATSVIDPDENSALDVYIVSFPADPPSCSLGVDGSIVRISNNFNRIQAANGASDKPIVSADGRYVAFESTATDIVPLSADTNGVKDIFLHDRVFGKNLRCNVTTDGDDDDSNPDEAVGGDSENAYLSSSGRFVVFESTATNLGGNNSNRNIYWAALSFADSGEPLLCDVKLVSQGVDEAGPNADTFAPVVSGDGNLVFFHSTATNLAEGDSSDSNAVADIFVANRQDCSAAPGVDTDQDGTPDCLDQCPSNSAKVIDFDTDGDGAPDCADGCASNPSKSSPGQCGCAALDTDTDSDGTADCNDACDDDPAKTEVGVCGCNIPDDDSDRDGTPDCDDLCPDDFRKVTPQLCGCGVEETDDTDADGVADCLDACPTDPNATLPGQCEPTATPTPIGPTPTPTLTPTITPTPTPTATATPDPTTVRPNRPNVRAVGSGRVRFAFDDYSQFGGTVVYEVLLRNEDKPRDKRRDIRFRTQKQTLTRRIRRGTYRVAYKVIIDGRSSPFSKLSRFIEVD